MTVFTDDELLFLSRYGFSTEDVYDGRGQSQEVRRQNAKAAGKLLVLGPRCRQMGHRLRTRSHHCVQCDPKKFAFQQRFSSPGYVYIAGSLLGQLIKIGTAGDITQREHQLKAEQHAGLSDWEVLFFIRVAEAGRMEFEARKRLEDSRVFKRYFKDHVSQIATEVFQCTFSDALEAISETVGNIDRHYKWQWTHAGRYDFS